MGSADNQAAERLLAADLSLVETAADGGSEPLRTASVELGTFDGCSVGLWDAGAGTDTDVEAHELFVVLSGRGSVTFEDGSTIELRPGVLVELREGDRTSWTITERLRKLYLFLGRD